MLIEDVVCVPVRSGFFADDQAAIRLDSRQDGFNYSAQSVTPGFDRVRVPGQAASVLLLLDDGRVAHGGCATVQYAGVGGQASYIQMVLNNSYLGLIRQAQRTFEMDYCVQLAFDNINTPN